MDTVQARSKGSASMMGRVVFKSSVLPRIDGEGILAPLCGSRASWTFGHDIRLQRCCPPRGGGRAPGHHPLADAGRTDKAAPTAPPNPYGDDRCRRRGTCGGSGRRSPPDARHPYACRS